MIEQLLAGRDGVIRRLGSIAGFFRRRRRAGRRHQMLGSRRTKGRLDGAADLVESRPRRLIGG